MRCALRRGHLFSVSSASCRVRAQTTKSELQVRSSSSTPAARHRKLGPAKHTNHSLDWRICRFVVFSGWRPAIAFLYLFLFHSLLCLTSFLSQYKMICRLMMALTPKRLFLSRHVAKGGSEGADEPPFFSDQKKSRWCSRLAAACSGCDCACMHRRRPA